MKSTTEQIRKIQAREPKVSGNGMTARTKETYHCDSHGSIPAKMNVKATVASVLNKIKK
jgi:hypothetical protein